MLGLIYGLVRSNKVHVADKSFPTEHQKETGP
jgi:hypothetical protein